MIPEGQTQTLSFVETLCSEGSFRRILYDCVLEKTGTTILISFPPGSIFHTMGSVSFNYYSNFLRNYEHNEAHMVLCSPFI